MTMNNLISFEAKRKSARRQYFLRYDRKIDEVVMRNCAEHISGSLGDMMVAFESYCRTESYLVWDQDSFRDHLHEIFAETMSPVILDELSKNFWFKQDYVTRDLIAEKCMTWFILDRGRVRA